MTEQNCHRHAPAASGDRITATTHGCTHLAVIEPFVPGATPVLISASSAPVAVTALMPSTAVPTLLANNASAHGPPLIPHASHATPLRI
jgi:hypothetical protein